MKMCKLCKKNKQLKSFNTAYKYKDTQYYESYCKKCHTIKSREWSQKNPEKNRAKALRWLHKQK